MYKVPYIRIPEEWHPKNYLMLYIHPNDFKSPTSVTSFKDLKDDSAAKFILFCLASIIERSDTGTPYSRSSGDLDQYYCREGVPKTVQIFEEVVTEGEEQLFRGYNFILLINDEAYQLEKYFVDMINANSKKKKSKKQGFEFYQSIDSIEKLQNLWSKYLGDRDYFASDQDLLNGSSSSITDADGLLNPFSILTAENAFKMYPSDVCEAQKHLSNYFDVSMGNYSIQGFKPNFCEDPLQNKFPKPERTYRLTTSFFNPTCLEKAPLPIAVRSILLEKRVEIERLKQ